MKDHFLNLLEYDNWANKKLIDSIISQNIENENILKIISHTGLSQQVWFFRLKQKNDFAINIWQILKISECSEIINEKYNEYKSFLLSTDENNFLKNISYKNSKGNEYTNTISDILLHVFSHSIYHRGQIAREMRRINKEPVLTDYIAYIREKG